MRSRISDTDPRKGSTLMRVGVISDTHGLLRPEAIACLRGCDHIVHAGDIGSADILEQLGMLAPVTAVRGNNDHGAWAELLQETEYLTLDGASIHVLHDLAQLDIEPAAAGVRVVISGHSHRPSLEERAGVLFVNPGSAGRRRFTLPIAVAQLEIVRGSVSARIIELLGKSPG